MVGLWWAAQVMWSSDVQGQEFCLHKSLGMDFQGEKSAAISQRVKISRRGWFCSKILVFKVVIFV